MIYGKLPVVFITTIASEKNGSTNSMIATYILDHLEDVKNMGIKELAFHCHVAMSSISRFCKEIGLRDFAELKELLNTSQFYFELQEYHETFKQRSHDHALKVYESLQKIEESIDELKIKKLCDDIKKYKKVAVFGLLKAGSVAMSMQNDMLMLGKQIYTNISYQEQISYITQAQKDDLIIILSYTGSYFDYQDLRAQRKNLYVPRIWMITSTVDQYPDFVDEIISFDSLKNQGSHPYQLQFVVDLVMQEYARK